MSKVKPVPEGFATVSVYLVVKSAVDALKFYEKAFGARPGARMPGPDGTSTMHAEMKIGDSTVMLTDENQEWGMKGPETLGGSPASMHLYVEDADEVYGKAVEAGCTVVLPIQDTFWGDRYAKIRDPFGHEWGIASRREDLTLQEMGARQREWMASQREASERSDLN
jgi:uncharacterized glyoxalase superfamily protein PhnB